MRNIHTYLTVRMLHCEICFVCTVLVIKEKWLNINTKLFMFGRPGVSVGT
jgi:hypothetical protein